MPSPYHTENDVRELAERLDGYFLGYYFDFLMEPGKRSALDKGKGTRAQTFRRRFLCYMLRVTFECDEILVEKALKKDRSSIRDGVDEFKELLIYNTWGLGIERFCERAFETERDYLQIFTRSDEKPDAEFIGWRRSVAAWAFFCACQAWRIRDPVRAAEHLSPAEVCELELGEREIAARPLAKSYKVIASENKKKAEFALEKAHKIVQYQPYTTQDGAKIIISHPAVALIERNRHLFKELNPMVCSDTAIPGDYFTLLHVEPDILKGKGERIRIKTMADRSSLAAAVGALIKTLQEAKMRPVLQLSPQPCVRKEGGFYALVRI